MFQQVTPSGGDIRQPPARGRLGIGLSLAEEYCGPLLIECDTGPPAVPQRVVFASAALDQMLLFGLNSNYRIRPPATGSEVLALST
jgi:hypothetical protein